MNRHGITVKTIAGLVLALALYSVANAQERYFVSGTGNDANTCTRLAPCRTFQRAHDVAADGNEIVALDSAGYGPVEVTKSITITGEGVYAGITVYAGTTGIFINCPSAVVVLRNLDLDGLAGTGDFGIFVKEADAVHVENCVLQGFKLGGFVVGPAANASTRLFVKDTVMRNSLINAVASGRAVFENCRFERNVTGVSILAGAKAIFHNCVIAGNKTLGLLVLNIGSKATLDFCQISNNDGGVSVVANGHVRISNSNITGNHVGIFSGPTGTLLSKLTAPGAYTNTLEDNVIDGVFTGTYLAK